MNEFELRPVYVRLPVNGEPAEELEAESASDFSSSEESLPREVPKQSKSGPVKRLFFGLFLFLTTFWLVAALGGSLFLGLQVKQCLSPAHNKAVELSFSPTNIKGLSLFAVAGTISVHSCPRAKAIGVHVSQAAHSADLLGSMKVEQEVKDGVLHIRAMGPTFDCRHCQLSHISVVIPAGMKDLNLAAQVIAGKIDVGSQVSYDTVELSASVGFVKVHNLEAKDLEVKLIGGYASVHDVKANHSQVMVNTGFAHLHRVTGVASVVEVELGGARIRELNAEKATTILVDIGYLCASLGHSKRVATFVNYGFLRVHPAGSYEFLMESAMGHLNVQVPHHHDHQAESSSLTVDRPTLKSGIVGDVHHADDEVFVVTRYAHATLVSDVPTKKKLDSTLQYAIDVEDHKKASA